MGPGSKAERERGLRNSSGTEGVQRVPWGGAAVPETPSEW